MRSRFGALHARAVRGELAHWRQEARGALALVILLDQLTRNLYRGSPQAFAHDDQARQITRQAIAEGLDQSLAGWERAFLYMPLMHSEDWADQEESARLFVEAGLDNAPWALHHRDIIRRFGRFPHRNAVLGRESTPEEQTYLTSEEGFKGQ